MLNRREEEREDYKYFRTTCRLIGFIVFFLGAFFAFLVAEETGQYYEYTIIAGFMMLCATAVFFCCVLCESNRVHSTEPQPVEWLHNRRDARIPEDSNEPQPEEELLHQPQPEDELLHQPQPEQELPLQPQPEPKLSGKPKTEPHWKDKARFDFSFIRQILGFSPRKSNETTSSENDTDPDMLELRKIAKSGLPAGREEPMAGTSKESQDKDTTRCEAAADFQLDSTKAGPSKVGGKSSEVTEYRSDVLSLKEMSTPSLSDSSKYTTDSEEKQAEVSAALSQLS